VKNEDPEPEKKYRQYKMRSKEDAFSLFLFLVDHLTKVMLPCFLISLPAIHLALSV